MIPSFGTGCAPCKVTTQVPATKHTNPLLGTCSNLHGNMAGKNNLQGKLVLETSHNKQIDVGELPAGIYTIKYYNKENIILRAEKLIIQ